ncbi:hypothetical protein [Glaciecola sp. SC05]|uniref:hypothetical protein n=1 Tax=Glaciecola sp. SC05 TaxID=1987355 RepID=UPI0035288845
MDNFETVIIWIVFIWIVVSSFLFSALEDRIVKGLKLQLGNNAHAIGKNTFSNPLQNFKNVIFFFKYKADDNDSDEVKALLRKGRILNILYYVQIAIIGIFMINFFESLGL